jgi:type I restriction enzyme S subunit
MVGKHSEARVDRDPPTTFGGVLARGFDMADARPWPLVRASSIFELKYGKALVESSRRPGPIPVYGSNGVTGWHDMPLFHGPGVVLGRKGMGNLGVEWVDGDFWVIDTAYSLNAADDVDLKFAYYLVGFVGLNHLKDGSSNPSLTREVFGSQLFPLPPLNEQQRIAGVLGALDDLINTNHKISIDLEDLLAAKFALAGFDEPSNNGNRLADLISINPQYPKPRTDAPYIDMAALPTDRARVASVARRAPSGGARFQNGDTVMARITPCLENGKTAYIDLLGPDEVGIGSTEFIVLRSAGMLGHHWSYFLARSPRFREYAVQHMSGTSGRQRCPADAIERYSIATPDQAVTSSFAELAAIFFEAIRELDEEAHQAARARDELLPLLLSGRVRVEDVAA